MSTPTTASPKTRTRTGCLTCRGRKLKCDEQKPICGQCHKSKRQCQPADGPFRHEHNASIIGTDNGKKKLDKFYKYRQEYDNGNYFLPVRDELKWVYVTDPYADDDNLTSSVPGFEYQQVAVNSLAVLTGHNDLPGQHEPALPSHPHHHPLSHEFGAMPTGARSGDVESLLNPEGTENIDPDLDLPPVPAGAGYGDAPGEDGGHKGLEDVATHAALYAALQEPDGSMENGSGIDTKQEIDEVVEAT